MQFLSNAALQLDRGLLSRLIVPAQAKTADNDNNVEAASDAMTEAALRFFGEHGLGAARAARHRAEQAFFAEDQVAYRHWLGICRVLDRRMARLAARTLESGGKSTA